MVFNKKSNREFMVFLLILAGLSGCGPKKKKSLNTSATKKVATLNIPVGGDRSETNDESIRNFFSDDQDSIDALIAQAEQEIGELPSKNEVVAQGGVDDLGDFSLINGPVASISESSVIYFDFDDYAIKNEQEQFLPTIIAQANSKGPDSIIHLEGHACSSAGSSTYNFAISSNRGNAVKNKLVALGFPEDRIKVVARGSEMPVIKDGKAVEGDKIAQAPNRRVEYRLA